MGRGYLLSIFLSCIWHAICGQLIITEISPNNSTLKDKDGEFSDWIEIYNAGSKDILLEDYFLSDEMLNLKKWSFPQNVTLKAKTYKLIFASSKNKVIGEELHCNFKINKYGETLILSNSNSIIDQIHFFSEIDDNTSIVRDANLDIFCCTQPSPEKVNDNYGDFVLCQDTIIRFSQTAGFYSNSLKIEIIQLGNYVGNIYYTLDGSEPNQNSNIYTKPLSIDTSVRLNAIFIFQIGIKSKIISANYLIDKIKSTLPVLSLYTPWENLYSDSFGIFVKGLHAESTYPYYGANFWSDTNFYCYFEMFNNHQQLFFQSKADMAMHGGSSNRNQAMKSFRLLAKEKYGNAYFSNSFFSQKRNVNKFRHLVLRNASSDFLKANFRDASLQRFISTCKLNLDNVAYEPYLVYINGKYHGLQELREKVDEHYIESNYFVAPSEVNVLEEDSFVIAGNRKEFDSLWTSILTANLSNANEYNLFTAYFDIKNLQDYFITETFLNNTDWPYNNIKYWNVPGKHKWRYILIDLDVSLNAYPWSAYTENHLAKILGPYGKANKHVDILKAFLKNNQFKRDFINRYADLMNTCFTKENFSNSIITTANELAPEIKRHFVKWGKDSMDWVNVLHKEVIPFTENRTNYAFEYVNSTFNLQGIHSVTIEQPDVRGFLTYIKCNSLQLNKLPWTGNYFHGNDITIDVQDDGFYRLKGWIINGDTLWSDQALALDPSQEFRIKPIIERNPTNNSVYLKSNLINKIAELYFIADRSKKENIYIFDLNGKCVKTFTMEAVKGLNTLTIFVGDIPNGSYIIKCLDNNIKFVKY